MINSRVTVMPYSQPSNSMVPRDLRIVDPSCVNIEKVFRAWASPSSWETSDSNRVPAFTTRLISVTSFFRCWEREVSVTLDSIRHAFTPELVSKTLGAVGIKADWLDASRDTTRELPASRLNRETSMFNLKSNYISFPIFSICSPLLAS